MASPKSTLPRIGAHTPTSGGMVKRSIEYALTTGAEAIQVFASNPRGWAMPDANIEADKAFRQKAEELDIDVYVHAPFLINLGSPTVGTYENSLASTAYSLKRAKEMAHLVQLFTQVRLLMRSMFRLHGSRSTRA